MTYTVAIKHNKTGEVRLHQCDFDWEEHSHWMWTEGDFGCDCNLQLFFERAIGVEPEYEVPCGEMEYTCLYAELEDGTKYKIDQS